MPLDELVRLTDLGDGKKTTPLQGRSPCCPHAVHGWEGNTLKKKKRYVNPQQAFENIFASCDMRVFFFCKDLRLLTTYLPDAFQDPDGDEVAGAHVGSQWGEQSKQHRPQGTQTQ